VFVEKARVSIEAFLRVEVLGAVALLPSVAKIDLFHDFFTKRKLLGFIKDFR